MSFWCNIHVIIIWYIISHIIVYQTQNSNTVYYITYKYFEIMKCIEYDTYTMPPGWNHKRKNSKIQCDNMAHYNVYKGFGINT